MATSSRRPSPSCRRRRCARRIDPASGVRPESVLAVRLAVAAELAPNDLSQAIPIELRADAVVLLKDRAGIARMATIVEIQRAEDPNKHWSWPLYVAAARSTMRCPIVLLVLAPTTRIARWAAKPIATGHPAFVLQPIVVDLQQFPAVDPSAESPELAVLAAIARPELRTVEVALEQIGSLDEEVRELYSIAIAAALPDALRQRLENHMSETRPSIFDYFPKTKARILDEGREEGRARGLREALTSLLVARFGPLDPEVSATIAGASVDGLRRWIERSATATTCAAVFGSP